MQEDPAAELAAQLLNLHAALAKATGPAEILQATLPYIGQQQPCAVALYYLPIADEGRSDELYLAAEWREPAQSPRGAPLSQRSVLTEYLTRARSASLAAEALLTSQLATEEGLPADLRGHLISQGVSALAILPLYSSSSETWHGLFTIEWSAPHAFSAVEQRAYRLLSYSLTGFVAGLRSQQAHAESLTEMRTLYEVGTRLNSSASMQEVLTVLASPVTGTAAEHARLYRVMTDAEGQPTDLVLAAEWGTPITPRPLGERRPLGLIDGLITDSPSSPVIIDDLKDEKRFTAGRMARLLENQVQSLILLPLYIHQRWVGLASLMWRTKHRFTARERRLFTGVMKQAALALDNRLHIEQAQLTLSENQEQRQLLSSILDSLPLGVWVLDAQTLQRRLVNRAGAGLASQLPVTAAPDADVAAHLCYPDTDTPIVLAELPFQRILQSDEPQRMEMDLVAPGRSRQSLECIAAPLHKKSGALDGVVAVFSDITERKQGIQERLRMQSELITAQAAALAERSTPVIPLSGRILVMPIIGSIDNERAAQIMDSLLAGIGRTSPRVALIDITGVPTVDSAAAAGLLNAARAVSLVGAEVVLTGIRAEVAHTLVKLGLELNGVVTCGTLQAGIAYAQKRWGRG